MEYTDIDFNDIEIKMTDYIWKLSKSGKLKWSRNELGYYLSSYKKVSVQIEFFNFSRMDEQSSDDSSGTIFIDTPDNRLGFDFSIGTKQYSNLKKAISFNFKNWKESLELGGRKYIDVLNYLEKNKLKFLKLVNC